MHAKELKRTTNTGRLAVEALVNSEIIVRGAGEENADGSFKAPRLNLMQSLLPGYRPILLFPYDEATELDDAYVHLFTNDPKPFQMLVPDGNWRQASKVHSRHPELANVPRVKISLENQSRVHLRAEHMPEGMSTLEAIARAIGQLESRDAEAALLELYSEKLSRTLRGRGIKN